MKKNEAGEILKYLAQEFKLVHDSHNTLLTQINYHNETQVEAITNLVNRITSLEEKIDELSKKIDHDNESKAPSPVEDKPNEEAASKEAIAERLEKILKVHNARKFVVFARVNGWSTQSEYERAVSKGLERYNMSKANSGDIYRVYVYGRYIHNFLRRIGVLPQSIKHPVDYTIREIVDRHVFETLVLVQNGMFVSVDGDAISFYNTAIIDHASQEETELFFKDLMGVKFDDGEPNFETTY